MEVQNASLTGLARINLERVKLGLYEMVLACNSDLEKCLGMNRQLISIYRYWKMQRRLGPQTWRNLEQAREVGASYYERSFRDRNG